MADGGASGILISIAVSLATTAISMGVQALLAPNVKGPRQKDSGIQGSDYGRPIPLVYGPTNRLAGTVIYYSGLQEQSRRKSGSGGSTTTYTYSCSAAILLGQGVDGAFMSRVWANKKLIYQDEELIETGKIVRGSPVTVAESIEFYDGNAAQAPDPTLEGYLGVGEVPAYRHSMYFVLKNLQLADFGPTLPYFDAEVRAHEEIGVDEVVTDIASRAGVTIDVSMLDGNVGTLDGYVIDQDVSASDSLIPLSVAYYFDVAERRGSMVAVPRGMDAVATIPASDFGAHDNPDDPTPRFAIFDRTPDTELAREVAVSFRSFYRDMQTVTQRSRTNNGTAKENLSFDLPLTLDDDQGVRIASRTLYEQRVGRRSARGSLSDKWLDVLAGDVVNIETPLGTHLPYRLTKSTRGANAVIDVELQATDKTIYTCGGVSGGEANAGVSGGTDPGTNTDAGETTWIRMDTSILRDAHNNSGVYGGFIGEADAWAGAQLFRSTDGGTDYEPVGRGMGPLTTGLLTSGAMPSGPTDVWDETTVLVVEMDRDGELESRSDLSVLNGLNVAWVGPASGKGGEIIQFADAVLIGTNTYAVSRLLRGRRGTEWATGRHGDGERFVLLSDSVNLDRLDFGAADLGLERLYKPVAMLTSIDDATAVAFTNGGEGLRPFSPAHLVGRRNSSSDVSLSWTRRTRLIVSGLAAPNPLGEQDETYRLDFHPAAEPWAAGQWAYAGDIVRAVSEIDHAWHWYEALQAHEMSESNRPDGESAYQGDYWRELSPLRHALIADQSTFTYTATMQATDGVTPGMTLNVQCRQRSATVGFGHPAVCVA